MCRTAVSSAFSYRGSVNSSGFPSPTSSSRLAARGVASRTATSSACLPVEVAQLAKAGQSASQGVVEGLQAACEIGRFRHADDQPVAAGRLPGRVTTMRTFIGFSVCAGR